ncbi:MAG TPA: enoyl-[acyl-carrier-protein] reductase [Gemmatimonadales bacterium]|nr:enoyl-[acyl-carrier-protein] reductase [Gemmatimonadales bacterium]
MTGGEGRMLSIDLRGKRALVAGVADDAGYGFAIAKALAEAGATVCAGTWPPALNIFLNLLERGKIDESRRLPNGSMLQFEKIYPLDAAYDVLADAPADIRGNKRYKDVGDFSVAGLAERLVQDFGLQPLDMVIHSLANGPEVKKPLLETSRGGYLAAVSVSAYSLVSLVGRLGPLMRPGGSVLSLTYMASERVVPGYGGGMSSAKAALESDTRTLAFEAGRKYGIRVNTISAGPLASRAASAIGKIERMVEYYAANAPLSEALTAREVGTTAAFLASPLASGITGATIYVDKGYHAMGVAVGTENLL